jgi:hypothetical protein
MKRFFLFFIIVCDLSLAAQTPVASWLWAKGYSGPKGDEGMAVAVDPSGNIVSTGFFQSSPLVCGSTTLTTAGFTDIYVMKHDANGNLLWARSFGGNNVDYSWDIATDLWGNIFITGAFCSPTVAFDNCQVFLSGGTTAFITKLSPSGNVLWAKTASGASAYTFVSRSVAVDLQGSAFITGEFQGTVAFGTFTLTNPATTSISAFLVKYHPNGTVLWATSPTSTSSCKGNAVACDGSGNVCFTGYISAQTSFGTYTVNPNSFNSAFVAKYDGAGNVLWANTAATSGTCSGSGIACDRNKNILVTGNFEGNINFGGQTATATTYDPFLVKMGPLGNLLWSKTATGNGFEFGTRVAADSSMNVVWLGRFDDQNSKPVIFGTTTLSASQGIDPYFVVKLDKDGNYLCIDKINSGGDDDGGLALNARGEAFVCADYWHSPFVVGPDTLYLQNPIMESIYLAKWRCEETGTGITEQNFETVLLFPNPVKNNLEIRIDNEHLFTKSIISIKTMQGHTAAKFSFARSLDCSGLIPGAYILEFISSTGKIYRGRFIKE